MGLDESLEMALLDQRKAERLPLTLPLTYRIDSPTGTLEGHTNTIDIGGGGVRFLVPKMLTSHSICYIVLLLPNQQEPLSLMGKVAWCRQKQGFRSTRTTSFEVGVAFTLSTSSDETFVRYCHFIAAQLLMKHLR